MKTKELRAAVKWLIGSLIAGIVIVLAIVLVPAWFLQYCLLPKNLISSSALVVACLATGGCLAERNSRRCAPGFMLMALALGIQLVVPVSSLREHYLLQLATVPAALAGGLMVFWQYEVQKQQTRKAKAA